MNPLLKWAGGKRWFVKRFPGLRNFSYTRYIEPFLGGGSVYFDLEPKCALLTDKNARLINFYSSLRNDWKALESSMIRHARNHSKEYYYQIRAKRFRSDLGRAAQFLYLNRTCWNGLYRENLKGVFNVPKGTKDSVLFEADDFQGASSLLRSATLVSYDFEPILEEAKATDLVFIDPPYTVKHNNNGFIKYNENIFSWNDQIRLSKIVRATSRTGARIVMTNASHESVLELYRGAAEVQDVRRASILAGNPTFRGSTDEALLLFNCTMSDLTTKE